MVHDMNQGEEDNVKDPNHTSFKYNKLTKEI